ncbi:MAG: hypothetical protein JNM34_07725 [Chthonomonadaceae bacterium]|nr:hypothetical protein [Chthonomonadaceae bacterium]
MSLTVTLSNIKSKAGVLTSEYDTKASALISELVPVLEFALEPAFLNDTANIGLQATLNLGATEYVAGELTAQLAREPGGSDSLLFGWLELRPSFRSLEDPYGLKAQAVARLAPFLKHKDKLQYSSGILTGGSRGVED